MAQKHRPTRTLTLWFEGVNGSHLAASMFRYEGRADGRADVLSLRSRGGYQAFGLLAIVTKLASLTGVVGGRRLVGRQGSPAQTLRESLTRTQVWHGDVFGGLTVDDKGFIRACVRRGHQGGTSFVQMREDLLHPSEIEIWWDGVEVSADRARLELLRQGMEQSWERATRPAKTTGQQLEDRFVGPEDVLSPTLLAGMSADLRKQDLKDVIQRETVSMQILAASATPPPLAECVAASMTVLPSSDADKDQPFKPGFKYNHFIQPGVVIEIPQPDGPSRVLGYVRDPDHTRPHHVHTRGLAILWGASYEYNVSRRPLSPMDEWMNEVCRNRKASARAFVEGASPVLLRLLDYKFQLAACDFQAEPLGVVTNDQRHEERGRVYTQYVFRLRLTSRGPSSPDDVSGIVQAAGVPLVPLPLTAERDPDEMFGDLRGRRNVMDVLVWRALCGTESGPHFSSGTAKFTRGFRIA